VFYVIYVIEDSSLVECDSASCPRKPESFSHFLFEPYLKNISSLLFLYVDIMIENCSRKS
jgi:hypothetical protein